MKKLSALEGYYYCATGSADNGITRKEKKAAKNEMFPDCIPGSLSSEPLSITQAGSRAATLRKANKKPTSRNPHQ